MNKLEAFKRIFTARVIVILGSLAAGFMLVGAASVTVWEYTNSDAFCANSCHDVHPEEPAAHEISRHANVQCVECHLGRLSFFPALFAKSKEVVHVWSYITSNFGRPTTSPTLAASEKSCKRCHSPQPHRNNKLKIYSYFAEDKNNTETRVGLVLRHVGRQTSDSPGTSIAWHTDAQIRFISRDAGKQDIPWVELTRKDGTTTIYRDVSNPLSEDEVTQSKKINMQCPDCHNRAGHPFYDPERVLDVALASGWLDKRLPFVKKRTKELLMQKFSSEADALQLTEAAWKKYLVDFPNLKKDFPDAWKKSKTFLDEQQTAFVKLMKYSRFNKPGISWRTFPENIGHKHSAGCFRCHDGKHLNENTTPIRINCTSCHSIPIPIIKGAVPQNLLETLNLSKPSSHSKPDFMVRHWTKYREQCSSCHRKFGYGTKSDEFCGNSSCHDVRWKTMPLSLKPKKY